MRVSEFKRLIREEVQGLLKEADSKKVVDKVMEIMRKKFGADGYHFMEDVISDIYNSVRANLIDYRIIDINKGYGHLTFDKFPNASVYFLYKPRKKLSINGISVALGDEDAISDAFMHDGS